ncbi:hypothetical protein F8B43_1523 [Methylorubrum populi]|uniref:Uncharacterized protein n=1 Tax=Methylorubrum populi TaxID=223967 RepID=A0A833J7X5_9HYPH|nr:hypothetical protein F8B43_1523 [Methylorubrum populi]
MVRAYARAGEKVNAALAFGSSTSGQALSGKAAQVLRRGGGKARHRGSWNRINRALLGGVSSPTAP